MSTDDTTHRCLAVLLTATTDEASVWPVAVVRSALRLLVGLQRSLVAHTSVPPQSNGGPADAAAAARAAACTTDFMHSAMTACEELLRDAHAAVENATGQSHMTFTQVARTTRFLPPIRLLGSSPPT
jgi:hypothetical protein